MRSPESQWWDRHKGGVVSVLFTEGGLARRIVGTLAWVDVFTIGITVPKNYTHLIFKHAIAKISPLVSDCETTDLESCSLDEALRRHSELGQPSS